MRGVLALALALALALPVVAAQFPAGTNPCDPGSFVVTHAALDSVPAGGPATATFSVQNNGGVDATVNLTASTAKTPGWKLSGPDSASQVVTANGGKASFTFTATSDPNVGQGPEIDVAGTAACQAPQGLPLACPSQGAGVCIVQLKSDSAIMQLAPKTGFHIPGLDGLDFPVEYLIAGIVLVAVLIAIPLALRRRRGAVANAALSCPEPLKPVRAGKGASFPIELKNTGDKATKLALDVGAVPEGWSAFLPLPEIQLAPKEARGLWLMVRAPPDAKSGDAAEVEVRASDPETSRSTTVKVRAEVMPGS
jgi:hypothetical protein